MFYKIYEAKSGYMIAVCDSELSGKILKTEDIEFHVNPRFYGTKEITEKKLIPLLKKMTSGNFIGKEAVSIALKLGLIEEKNITYIGDVPHAQFFIMRM
jgi:hypothetical protein